jgi:hypothetical protein
MIFSAPRLLLAAIIFAALPFARAHADAPSLDQYPSFIEYSATAKDGVQIAWRCGYAAKDRAVALDPAFQESATLDPGHGTYVRIQHIDNSIVSSVSASAGGAQLLLELVRPDGSIAAKLCDRNPQADMIGNCRPAQPVQPAQQIVAAAQQLAAQCGTLFQQSVAKIDPSLANPQKTQQFMAGLRQKVAILNAQ